MGAPVAIGMIVVVAIAVTLGPAVLFLGSRVGLVRIQTTSQEPVLATGRHRRGPLARTDFGGQPVRGADRHRGHSGLQAGLQRPLLPARRRPDQHRLRRRRPAFLAGPDEPRHPDGRGRPRHAQSRRHAGAERGGPKCDAHRGHCDGAEHHPAVGHPDPAQLDSVPDERSGADQQHEPAVPAGSIGQPAQNDRCDERLDRHPGEAVPTLAQADPAHAGLGGQVAGPARDHRGAARQHRELRRPVPAVAQLLLLGTALLRHPAVRRGAVPLRFPRRDRRSDRQDGSGAGQHRPTGGPRTAVDRTSSADDRVDEGQQGPVAGVVQLAEGPARPDAGDQRHRPGDGRRASTRPRTTTCSSCPRRPSRTPTSSAV